MEERLAPLRALMKEQSIQAWIIPSADPHNSEYVAPHFATRAWFSGFTGSAGTLVLTAGQAALWTDTRYELQAAAQLAGTAITLFVDGRPDTPELAVWLRQHLPAGSQVSFDARCMVLNQFNELERKLQLHDIRLVPGTDLPGQVWPSRPALTAAPVRSWTGPQDQGGIKGRLQRLLKYLADCNRDWIMLSALDQIAWLLGLRGSDIPYNPLFMAYFLAGPRGSVLFLDRDRLAPELLSLLLEHDIALADYQAAGAWLQTLPSDDRIILPPESTNLHISQNAAHMRCTQEESPLDAWKAVLEPHQVAALKETCTRDGVALVRALAGIDGPDGVRAEKGLSDEAAVAGRIMAERGKEDGYAGESFAPIVGFRGNAAIVHYQAPDSGSAVLEGRGLLLVDCGAQYQAGTTDITRTFLLGGPAEPEEKLVYTLVLKGHIRLATAGFPAGTRGQQLDILARQALWEHGYNYGHGTGHGIGFSLCVHEGPQRIAPLASRQVLLPGMVLSNEPGCYLAGRFGVRLENMVLVVPDPRRPGFLGFETLSLFPLEPALLDLSLLEPAELAWINAYHERVQTTLGKKLEREAKAWLKEKTRSLPG